MNETLFLTLTFMAGLVLGALFFGGLWFTVRKAVSANVPALWLIGGFIIRTGITLIGFYYVSIGSWQRMLSCLVGFVVARMLVMKVTKRYDKKRITLDMKINHEA